jgi:hypothetical protein
VADFRLPSLSPLLVIHLSASSDGCLWPFSFAYRRPRGQSPSV